jgi:hypothetical protein
MLLNCFSDSIKSRPFAMRMLAAGLLMVSCGSAWPRILAPHLHLQAGVDDFVQGLCFGLGIAIEIGAVVLLRLIANRQKQQSATPQNL